MNRFETYRIHVEGKVQGVWFRASTKRKALALGLTGTVENVSDGSVFIVASGPQDKLDELIKWCWKGPEFSRVIKVTCTKTSPLESDDFRIIR